MPLVLTEQETTKAIETIKFDLQERQFPFFEEAELSFLLERNLNIVDLAIYDGLLKKARVDSIKLSNGLEKPNNREYWLNLANVMKNKLLSSINSGIYDDILPEIQALGILPLSKGKVYILKRADGV